MKIRLAVQVPPEAKNLATLDGRGLPFENSIFGDNFFLTVNSHYFSLWYVQDSSVEYFGNRRHTPVHLLEGMYPGDGLDNLVYRLLWVGENHLRDKLISRLLL